LVIDYAFEHATILFVGKEKSDKKPKQGIKRNEDDFKYASY